MRRKKENWLVTLYKENKLYVWVIVGVLAISGLSIGMAMGQSKIDEPKIIEDTNQYSIDKDNENLSYVTNVKPIKDNKNDTQDKKEDTSIKIQNQNKPNKQEVDKKTEEAKVTEKKLQFIMPVEGEVYRDFSEDTLVYSNTLEEWINHIGIDISSEKATPVKAIEDGIVTDIKQDPRYGYTIIIDHGQGFTSVYCNLSTLDMVYLNKNVEKGQVISGVGDTALFESKDNAHLHFELIKDDKYINPVNYIK